MGLVVQADARQLNSSHQPHPTEGDPQTSVGGERQCISLSAPPTSQEEHSDSEDDGSTEGDGEDGKVLSAERPPDATMDEEGVGNKTTPPLTEYIVNVVHFLDAILSNNSTDDHMREFISQGGMEPLLKLLSLPVLPLDFPTSAACTSITGACRNIMVRQACDHAPLPSVCGSTPSPPLSVYVQPPPLHYLCMSSPLLSTFRVCPLPPLHIPCMSSPILSTVRVSTPSKVCM